jgi:cell filamentation protein
MRSHDEDPYVYPGTDVLRNKGDFRDAEGLQAFERLSSANRLESLPRDMPMTAAGYRLIHAHIFQDVYEWAGEDRTVRIHRPGAPFCFPAFIAAQLDERFSKLAAENRLLDLTPQQFAERAAEHVSELNAIHPFREGNGRTLRAFLRLLADHAGHPVDLTRISPRDWHDASVSGFEQRYAVMTAVIEAAIGAQPTHPTIIVPRRRPESD